MVRAGRAGTTDSITARDTAVDPTPSKSAVTITTSNGAVTHPSGCGSGNINSIAFSTAQAAL